MRVNRSAAGALLSVLLLAACQSDGESESTEAAEEKEEAAPIPVETAQPTRGNVYAMYTGTAPIEAFAEADVIAKVAGEIRELLIEEGQDVRKDQVLARLDGDRLRLELNESQARLRKLQRDYERNVDLKAKGLISDGDFERIKFEMEALEASFNLARLELDYTQIRAPIDGVVSERYVKMGNTISVGEPLFRVTSLNPLVAYLHVPEREYRNIQPGQPVGIDIDALPDEPIVATVSRVSPIVDPQTGTFKITIEIVDNERRIKPGMFGRIGVVYDVHENALQVPRSAVVEDGGTVSVFVVEDDVAIRKTVTLGYGNRGLVEIMSGLEDGEDVVTVGQASLKQDSRVTVINRPENDETAVDPEASDTEQRLSENATTD
jgi:membrane fusion protein (multidrug efflux system)